jgi:hypothetical protein
MISRSSSANAAMMWSPRHLVGLIRVDVLRHRHQAHTERYQLLDALDRIGDAPAPSVQLPDKHCIESPLAGIARESVQLWPARFGSAPAGIDILGVDLPLTRGVVVAKLAELRLAVLVGSTLTYRPAP